MKNKTQQIMNSMTIMFTSVILMMCVLASLPVKAESTSSKKVLMVVSGYGQQQGEKTPGYEFDEFSKAYLVFKANGLAVDVASPKGGKVEADKYDAKAQYNAKVLADSAIMSKLHNTLAMQTLEAKNYAAVFVVGGKGAMFDLPKDKALQRLIADIYQQQGSVAAVCHGPAALVDVKLNDGSYLVANKAINGFTNTEEQLFGQKWLAKFDFKLEDKLIERGGKFQASDIMLSHVAVDGRLITGQNPTSTTGVATALVASLGMEPVQLAPSRDDKTLAQVAKLLAGDDSVIANLQANEQDYHLALVGMYGFYYLKIAQSTEQTEHALNLMMVAKPAIKSPMLDLKIASAQQKLGRNALAKETINALLETKPDYQPALEMLKTL
jgi:putative intracellular protease/amidase